MSNIAIIPARGGSVRIPRKNIRMFQGKPIIAYSIETAQASGLFDKILVSTDDLQIAGIARDFGAAYLLRPPELSADHVGTQEVMAAVLKQYSEYELACCIYATAPMMTANDLRHGLETLRMNPGRAFAYSVNGVGGDAGQWYWGHVENFLSNTPLHWGVCVAIPDARVCDINTEGDWNRAHRMYDEVYGVP